jgi:micrococcal nuclease
MADKDPYIYRIKSVGRVVDGDTIDADIDLGFDISLTKEFVWRVLIPQRAERKTSKKKNWNRRKKLVKAQTGRCGRYYHSD